MLSTQAEALYGVTTPLAVYNSSINMRNFLDKLENDEGTTQRLSTSRGQIYTHVQWGERGNPLEFFFSDLLGNKKGRDGVHDEEDLLMCPARGGENERAFFFVV